MTDTNDDDEAGRRLFTSRREFMQVAGTVTAGGLLTAMEPAAAQETVDISLEAVELPSGIARYDDDQANGIIDAVELPDAIEDWREGDLGTQELIEVINHWHSGESVADEPGEGGRAWLGSTQDENELERNPTLSLTAGQTYDLELTNELGVAQEFVIEDDDGSVIESFSLDATQGATTTVSVTATESMAAYYSSAYPTEMRGTVDVSGVTAPSEDRISVLCLGGPAGGSHNGPARARQLMPYLLERGIEVLYTHNHADLEADPLHRYDALMIYDNHSDLTQEQEDSIVSFVENGGGFVPIHSASGCFTGSDRFIELVGGQFLSHGTGEMTTNHVKPDHPILADLDPIESWDETYRHQNLNPDNVVLAYGDFPDYGPDEEPEPWMWVREEGDGRVFYTAWGHGPEPWSKPGFKKLIENAIRWTTGNEDTISTDSRVLDPLEFVEPEDGFIPNDAYEGYRNGEQVPPEVGSGTEWTMLQRALTAEESVKRTMTPEGFDLEPFVTENDLPDDVAGNILDVEFDPQGRAWLALTRDYPNQLGEGRDTIVVCEDTTGDGTADDFTVFADGLSIPLNMVLTDEGVITVNLGEFDNNGAIVHLKDTTGDGTADTREELFSGFGTGDTHASCNQLEWGVDNWIWGQVGYSGFSGEVGGEQHDFSSAIFRFRPDGSELEIVASLPGNQAGLGFNEEGLAFASAATAGQPSNYVAIPNSYYGMVNGFSASTLGGISDSNRFLPMTNRVRQGDLAGGYTAASGHEIYTAREYPEKYWNRTGFVGAPTGHLLGKWVIEPDGAGFEATYPSNMAVSTDSWFSPIYSTMGPDGMLWFIDWYNWVILHNVLTSNVTYGPGNAYENELRDHTHARLYRLNYGDGTAVPTRDLSDASPSELVEALSDTNMFWRRTAQRMLVQRGETDVVGDLVNLVTTETLDDIGLDPGAIHALWTLHGLGALDPDTGSDAAITAAQGALTHSSAGVRLTALRVVPSTAGTPHAILDNGLLMDDNPRVAMWALLKLAQTPESDASGEAVYEMISTEPNYEDDVLVDAATIAGSQHADGFITAYEANEDLDDGDEELPNLLDNPGFEEAAGGAGFQAMPEGWATQTWGGTATYAIDTEVSHSGDQSILISSQEGADASWSQTVAVEQDTEYTYTAWVKTEDLEGVTDNGPYGALINFQQDAANTIAAVESDGTNDWTQLETTFDSGGNTELRINCSLGGFGESSGTVWFDDVSLTPTDSSDTGNLATNPGFEEYASGPETVTPAEWFTTTFNGNAEFEYTADTAHSGEGSVMISSEEGIDGAWSQIVPVEPNTEYTYSMWVKTEDLADESGGFDGGPYGALINVQEMAVDTRTPVESSTGSTDWTKLEATFDSGDNETLQLNGTVGGWGLTSGTVWFDDATLTKTGSSEGANPIENPGFETTTAVGMGSPKNWETWQAGGQATYNYAATGRTGDRSIQIDAQDGGVDGGWMTMASVEPNTEYTFTAWAKAENVELVGSNTEGVFINAQVDPAATVSNTITDGSTDWTKLETSFNSGNNEEVRLNCSLGGFGLAEGVAWFDDLSVTDPDGNEVLENPSFETPAGVSPDPEAPASWSTSTYSGSAEYEYSTDVSRSGGRSVVISSEEGIDGGWSQVLPVEPNSTYRFTAWIKTEDLEAGDSYGAIINPHQMGQDVISNTAPTGTNDWTKLETTFNSGGNQQIQFNLTMGGWGQATGTVWFDDVKVVQTAGGAGLEAVYERIKRHRELEDGNGGGTEPETIEPGTTIQLETPSNAAFAATAPSSVAGTDNPTLRLEEGAEYTIEWTNTNGSVHNLQVLTTETEGSDVPDSAVAAGTGLVATQGESASVTFTATGDLVRYRCEPHDLNGMGDSIEVVSGDGSAGSQ